VRLEWMMFCRYIETTDAGTTIVGAGIDGFQVPDVPARIVAHAAFLLAASYYELEAGEVPMSIRVLAPDMSEASIEKGLLRLEGAADPNFPPGAEGKRILAWDVEWDAVEHGSYTVEMSLGDGEPLTQTFYVVRPRA
jgi:hypothetical protein